MIKAVFFDFYYTLGVWGEPLEDRIQRIAERYDFDVDWERYAVAVRSLYADASDSDPKTHAIFETMEKIVKSYGEFIKQIGVNEHVDQITWELLQSEHSLFAANNAILYKDTIPTLKRLKKDGFKLAIVSNWDTPLFPLLERLEIAHYFDTITASHDMRIRSAKPDAYIFKHTLNEIGVTPEETVHVGDTYEADIIGAQAVGIRPILIDREGNHQGRWGETIKSLTELHDLLEQ